LLIETEGVALNSLSRAELMAKLAAREPSASEQSPPPVTAPIAL
jgi:RNA-binding protein 39